MDQDQLEVAPEMEATTEDVTQEATAEPTPENDAAPNADVTPQSEGDEIAEATAGKSRHQRRRDAKAKLHAEKEAIAAELAEANAQLAELARLSAGERPKETDFATFEEYQAALAGHAAVARLDGRQRAEIERKREAHQREADRIDQQTKQEIAQGWVSQVEDARTRYSDFEQVALTAPISDQVAEVVAQMDMGADVAYHLGMNPADAERINKLSPINAAMELGRIEARLSKPTPRNKTNAPDPVNPVKPKASLATDPSKMTADEFAKWRDAGGTF